MGAASLVVVVGASLLVSVSVLPASAAPMATEVEPTLVELDGEVMHVAVDRGHPEEAVEGDLEVLSFVDVEGTLVQVPADVPLPAGTQTGDPVVVTVLPGEESAGAPQGPLGDPEEAVVVDVAAVEVEQFAGTAPLAASTTAAAPVAGTHTLTVLPVHWGTPDAPTTQLRALAETTRVYWSEQSAGRIAVVPEVREYARIQDPGSCNPTTLLDRALAAHGVARPTATSHLLVYFPRRADCGGWAGLASIGGGAIWVNGAPIADVFAHELGHNFGLGHANTASCTSSGTDVALAFPFTTACTVKEYADRADVMGIATTSASGNLNTAFADHLGLATVVRPTAGMTTLVELEPLSAAGGLRSVAIPVENGTVYVDYRPAAGRDVRLPAWAGVQVHHRTMHPTYGYPTTYLLDMAPETTTPFSTPALGTGRSWRVPGTNQVVTVLGTSSRAAVAVSSDNQAVLTTSSNAAYTAVVPKRAVDARTGVTPHVPRCVQIAGTAGVPAGASGVVLNVTTVVPQGSGHVVVYPDTGGSPPETSTVNFVPGQDVANAAVVALPENGRVCFMVRGARAGLILDVTGYMTAASGFALRTPTRLEDRLSVSNGREVVVQVTGRAGVPAGARAVLLNVTVAGSTSAGNLRLYPTGAARPGTSNLNYPVGGDRATAAVAALSPEGKLTYFSETAQDNSVRVVLDVVGYIEGGTAYAPVPAVRLADTRKSGALQAGQQMNIAVPRSTGVPDHATAVVLNVAAVAPSSFGHMRVFPLRRGEGVPTASSLNYIRGADVSNLVVVGLGDDRNVSLYTDQPAGEQTHAVVDVVGYLTATP